MFQQPGMLGGGFLCRKGRQMGQDVVFGGNVQRFADGGKIVHGDRQGAVHVKHPMTNVVQVHAQSLRWRISPSWHDDATSCPARLKILPREKPRALPAQGLSIAYSNQSSARRLP